MNPDRRIAIVDDDDAIRDALTALFSTSCYPVRSLRGNPRK
jgi:FixJ family two-component response regulator